MNKYRLANFDRGIQIDSKSLRMELSTLRGKDEGQLSETTFTDWRRKAGATRNRHFVTQVQAVLILWQALYPESGKRSVARHEGKPKPLTKIFPTKYRHYCDQWLADGDIPAQGLRILSWIHGVGVTPKQLETIAQGQSDPEIDPPDSDADNSETSAISDPEIDPPDSDADNSETSTIDEERLTLIEDLKLKADELPIDRLRALIKFIS